MKPTNNNTYVLPAILIISIVTDLASTYYSTPDLKNEANWFVVNFHLKWSGLFLVVFLSWCLDISLYYYHCTQFKYFPARKKLLTFRDYCNFHLNYCTDSFPVNKSYLVDILRVFANGLGFFSIRLSIFLKFFFTFGNILNGWIVKYYNFDLVSKNSLHKKFIVTSVNSPFENNSILEKLTIWWAFNEQEVESVWLNFMLILFVPILILTFIKKEKKRIDYTLSVGLDLHSELN